MDLGLKDKVVIVTGGGAGIGGAVSLGLAAEGAIPVVFGRSPLAEDFAAKLKAASPRSMFVQVELMHDPEIGAAVEQVAKTFGRIDGLVNNAGINDGVGLDAGPMSGFDRARVDELFLAGTGWRSNFLVNIGYADRAGAAAAAPLPPRDPRLSFDEACRLE